MQNPSHWIMAAVIIAFVAFGVETDIYVPSLPDMATYFRVGESVIQTVLSVNFFSLFIGCLLSGPYSDRFGRRRFLVNGLALFFLSSIGCAVATNFELLLVMRFLQGLGAGTILGLAMTVVFDVYGTEKGAGKVGFMNGLVTIAMAAAPFAGSKLNQHFSWQAAFWFIVAMSGLAYWMVYRFIPETVKPEQRLKSLSLGEVVVNYGRLLVDPWFLCNTLLWNVMFGCLIVYIANVSLIFINTLQVPADVFAYYQTSAMVAFCIASFIAARFASFFGISRGEWIGGAVFFVGAAMLVGVGTMYPDSPILISTSMVLISGGMAIAVLGFFSESLQTVGNKAGAAVSLAQSVRMLILAAMTELSRLAFDGTIIGVVKVVAPAVLLCALILIVREKFRPSNTPVVDAVHGVA